MALAHRRGQSVPLGQLSDRRTLFGGIGQRLLRKVPCFAEVADSRAKPHLRRVFGGLTCLERHDPDARASCPSTTPDRIQRYASRSEPSHPASWPRLATSPSRRAPAGDRARRLLLSVKVASLPEGISGTVRRAWMTSTTGIASLRPCQKPMPAGA